MSNVTQTYTTRLPKPEDTEAIARMHAQSWLDTYPNEEAGVSKEWVAQRAYERILSPSALERRRGLLKGDLADPDHHYYKVAVNKQGKVVGLLRAEKTPKKQELTAIYIAKEAQGTGLAQELFDDLLPWFDGSRPIKLEVVEYNQRAIRFYEKQGFKKVPGSEYKFEDVMPSFWMIREATT